MSDKFEIEDLLFGEAVNMSIGQSAILRSGAPAARIIDKVLFRAKWAKKTKRGSSKNQCMMSQAIFFSSPSIQQAEENIEAFERVNKDKRFVPYLYLSVTALYERFCPSSDRLNHIEVLEEGGSLWLHAVYERQRDVYNAMFANRCRLFVQTPVQRYDLEFLSVSAEVQIYV